MSRIRRTRVLECMHKHLNMLTHPNKYSPEDVKQLEKDCTKYMREYLSEMKQAHITMEEAFIMLFDSNEAKYKQNSIIERTLAASARVLGYKRENNIRSDKQLPDDLKHIKPLVKRIQKIYLIPPKIVSKFTNEFYKLIFKN